ncbi:MAG: hypothetical protein JWN75_1156, partial [Candidatus Saccharibacteria bacterium]|nr:hypothetical protein [Candidatus Saccharibacteria bacterium]
LHISDLITAKRDLGWEFIFLAAGQDAIATATTLSIPAADAYTFAQNLAEEAFVIMSDRVSEKRLK